MPQLPVSRRAQERPRQVSNTRTAAARRVGLLALAVLVVGAALPVTQMAARNGQPIAQPSARGSGQQRGSWLITFRNGVPARDATAILAAAGATEVGRLDDLGTRVIKPPRGNPAAALRRLAADPRVTSVEQDVVAAAALVPNDPRWSKAWGPRRMRAPEAWNVTTGSAKTVIAIIDTGVDPRHPELRGRLVPGWDFQNGDSNPRDDNGHGTAVANVAAAGGNDGVGMSGLCWKCKIMPVKVLNANGSGTHSNIAAGIIWAVRHGADVINMSIAGPRPTNVVADAIAFARRKGVIVIAAAGNEGSRRKHYPAAYPGVISVGASNAADSLYKWSNRGAWVKVSAPGCAFTGKPGPAWSWWCGTSFATPAVAGTAALIVSLRPGISRNKLEQLLLSSTVRVRGVTKGRVDAAKAVRKAAAMDADTKPKPTPTPTPTPTPKPKPTPTPSRPSYEWDNHMSAGDRQDYRDVFLGGSNYISVEWWSGVEMTVRVRNKKGVDVLQFTDRDGFHDEEFWTEPGKYRVIFNQQSDVWTDYHVHVNCPQESSC